MNWLDVVLAAVLLGSTVAGFMKGFFRLAIGLAATVLAFLLASWFYAEAGEWAIPYASSKGVANFVGYLLVFIGVMVVGTLLARLMAKLFKWIGLSWLDRLGGGVLGLLRGGLVALVLVMMISAFLPGSPPPAIIHSRLAPHVLEAANYLSFTTSPEMKQQFRQTYEKARNFRKLDQ